MGEEPTAAARGDHADAPERDTAGVPEVAPGRSGWVTTRVAAEALGVNPRTIRTYIERGDIEAKAEGTGIQKTYLVSIDSVYALRDRRGYPRHTRDKPRERSAEATPADVPAGELTEIIRDLTSELVQRSQESAELRTRLELTAQAESTLREQLERERERADRLANVREEAQRLREELEAERSKGFWRRLFGG
jgi:hypothetical protein